MAFSFISGMFLFLFSSESILHQRLHNYLRKNSSVKKVDKMCHHWKGIKEACESTLSFSEDARRHFSSPSPAFFEKALVKHSRKLPEYLPFGWYFLLGPIFLGPLLLRLKNFLAITCQSSWQANGAGADTEAAFGFVCFCRLPGLCGQVHKAAPVVDQTNCLESQLLAWLWHKNLCCSHRNLVLNRSIISGKPKIRWIKHSFCSYPREGLCKGIWICSYAQYATGSRNRTSSSSTN